MKEALNAIICTETNHIETEAVHYIRLKFKLKVSSFSSSVTYLDLVPHHN